ncbi:Maltose/maltodextrin import ATP-binding protein MalK [Pseudovibrio sp. Ad5]|uniref:ABC transporter ATP-binding protein n=1 Tax=Pseudovibrio sp. Ad5 TaxID=989436 RepID=UPI0007AE6B12|nr:sn-glycerol-3-phosphate ABC transporter ATP-binding protein UgpC [Pseudovibrio sp. Ad5]KZL01522.1 Maltose/maltodextrin import ATP-binding protein MalK [Pseudovibrio sp. Ad5]
MAGVDIKQLYKSFGKTEVLTGIDLSIRDGEFVSFLGPSGCGKTTLLRSIAGLEEVSGGSVRLGERNITQLPPAKRDIAMVFQNYALYPHMNVYKNLSFGLSLNGVPKVEIEERVQTAARILQISDLLKRRPRQLSGGQRQRVAIGRAIVRDPKLFLLDEPLSNLDAGLRVSMRVELASLHRRLGVTMIYVTHDQVEAMTLSSRVVVLNKGVVAQFGTPLELFYAPQNLFVAGFIGSPKMNMMKVNANAINEMNVALTSESISGSISFQLSAPVQQVPDQPHTFGIRPENVGLVEEAESHMSGNVELVERLGTESQVHVRLNSGQGLTAVTRGTHPVNMGDRVHLNFPAEHCHLFSPEGEAYPRKLDGETRSLIERQETAALCIA